MFGQCSWHKCESFAHFTQDERVVLANLSTPSLAQSRSAKEGVLAPNQIQIAHFFQLRCRFTALCFVCVSALSLIDTGARVCSETYWSR